MEKETSKEAAKEMAMGQALRNVSLTLADVVRSELHLAKMEMKDAGSKLGHHAIEMGTALGVTVLGLFPLVAFLVIGLGEILHGNFWLSSLIISLIFMAIGAILGRRVYLKFRTEELLLPETRETVRNETEAIGKKLHQLSEERRRFRI